MDTIILVLIIIGILLLLKIFYLDEKKELHDNMKEIRSEINDYNLKNR